MYRLVFKRLFDIIGALILIALLTPLLIFTAILVRFTIGSPVIFTQKRPGKSGKSFNMYKFRSMTNELDKDGKLLDDSIRLTKVGSFLRKTSIDELPELFNILLGDMSFVGPRPLLESYLPLYSDEQSKRHLVKPGLTGLAQVNGRNSLTWEKKFEYDVNYVQKVTMINDLKIAFQTIIVVFKREGINSNEFQIMEPFTGSKSLYETE